MVEQSQEMIEFQHQKNALDSIILEQLQINVNSKVTISKLATENESLKKQLDALSKTNAQ